MAERSGPWDGTSIGDAAEAAYDAPTEFARFFEGLHGGTTNRGGVVTSKHNELVVSGVGSPLSVAAGWAFVYGTWYESDAAVSVAVPTPAVSTRIDRIVLRKNWAAQTVRVTRVAGVEGGGAPALVQIVGVTWDFPLAQASITTGGVITLTDQRIFIPKVAFNDAEGDPAPISIVAAADGTSQFSARRDHVHKYAPSTLFDDTEGQPADLADVSADGVSNFAARRDHAHNGFNDGGGDPATVVSAVASDGVVDFAARRDHQHHLGLLEGCSASAIATPDFGAGALTVPWTEIIDDNNMHAPGGTDLIAVKGGKYLYGFDINVSANVGAINVTVAVGLISQTLAISGPTGEAVFSGSFIERFAPGGTINAIVTSDGAGTRVETTSRIYLQYIGD